MGNWEMEICNDPIKDYRLYFELLNNEEYKGRIYRNENMELVLEIYSEPEIIIPIDWLKDIISQAEKDLVE